MYFIYSDPFVYLTDIINTLHVLDPCKLTCSNSFPLLPCSFFSVIFFLLCMYSTVYVCMFHVDTAFWISTLLYVNIESEINSILFFEKYMYFGYVFEFLLKSFK